MAASSDWSCLLTWTVLMALLGQGSWAQVSGCGSAPLNSGVLNGSDAPAGSWPWQASIHRSGSHVCGGSLISNQWVLTAASCFPSTSTSGLTVYLGRQNQTGSNPNEQVRTPFRISRHPDYDASTHENDIALVLLAAPLVYSDYVQPVCLADSSSAFHTDTESLVTGWRNAAGVLQQVRVPVMGNRQCICLHGSNSITDNMMCAADLSSDNQTCVGDSGAPLVVKQGSAWVQAGIASQGGRCGGAGVPGVYTRISHYMDWINLQGVTPGYVSFLSPGQDSSDLNVTCAALTTTTGGPTSPPITTTSNLPKVCGRAPLNTGVISGQDAPAGSWPWQASFHRNGSHFCGGSLVSKQWILTAAHCFPSTSTFDLTVYLGLQSQEGSNSNRQIRFVARIEKHPDYNATSRDNDIALVLLSAALTFSDYIRPVCLAANGSVFHNATESWVTGWPNSTAESPATLQQAAPLVVGNRQCNCTRKDLDITDDLICAGADTGGTCQRDLGGPLVSRWSTVWVQSGVVPSGGRECNSSLSVYTRTSIYQTWISYHLAVDPAEFVMFDSTVDDADSSFKCPVAPETTTPPPSAKTTTLPPRSFASALRASFLQLCAGLVSVLCLCTAVTL
ncbi:transmembrane protease serine 9-like [Engraulis encrasicolus]|uniref:transmembrane protease serine 9-like n=1 Tax=Engraulis encrasicolus TaxID=184585 RepID=UPI002FCF59B6